MPYRYTTNKIDYTHYSSGRVLVNLPGRPAFPARLSSEVFQRLLALRRKDGLSTPVHLFDPCCGGAYHLAVLGLLHREQIVTIAASDIDPRALEVAKRNLGMLGSGGMRERLAQIDKMHKEFGKVSHAEALQSARFLLEQVTMQETTHSILVRSFQADAFDSASLHAGLQGNPVDLVFSDLPYGLHAHWQGQAANQGDAVHRLLESLAQVLLPGTLLALATLKDTRLSHPAYIPSGRLKLGKRLVTFLRLGN
jgi:SAM-dependent methyltransferase